MIGMLNEETEDELDYDSLDEIQEKMEGKTDLKTLREKVETWMVSMSEEVLSRIFLPFDSCLLTF